MWDNNEKKWMENFNVKIILISKFQMKDKLVPKIRMCI